jgi:hypothetical protein
LDETDTRTQRKAVLLLVLLLHGILIEELIREQKRIQFTIREISDALLLYPIAREPSPISNAPNAESLANAPRKNSLLERKATPENPPDARVNPPVETVPPAPQIDWQHELELSAQNGVTAQQKENFYRDLSKSMSPAQLDWLRHHHMEPANPGIAWKSPRVEVTKNGMPIVHVNDHCVLVPLLFVPMVFCAIGHIEPNGDLFTHMHGPTAP